MQQLEHEWSAQRHVVLKGPIPSRRSKGNQGGDTHAFRKTQVLRNVDNAVVSPKACRIAVKNSRLLGGFWKKATAPASSARFLFLAGSRALSTMTGVAIRSVRPLIRSKTRETSPYGTPRSG